MSIYNIRFYGEITNIFPELSSNTPPIKVLYFMFLNPVNTFYK